MNSLINLAVSVTFDLVMFFIIVIVSVICLIIWKKIIDPDGGTLWIYLIWVLLCVLIAALLYQPWVCFQ